MTESERPALGQGSSDDIYALREEPTHRLLPAERSPKPRDERSPSENNEDDQRKQRAADKEELLRLTEEAIRGAPPKWLFFRNTFSFPFQRESLVCTISLSIWAIVALGLPATGLFRLGSKSADVALLSFLLAVSGQIILLTLWFLTASSAGLTILRDTSYGHKDVQRWTGLSEGLGDSLFIISSFMISAGLGSLVGRAGGEIGTAIAAMAGVLVLFPVILLSMLETNSPINPFSLSVWKSILVAWHAWALFYLLTFATVAVVVPLLSAVSNRSGLLASCLVTGPVIAIGWMIYFRLLGRLALFCSGGTAAHNLPDEND